MARAVSDGIVSFGQATVFLLDEFGGLDEGDPGRCDVMIQRDLLDLIDLPADRFHRLDPSAPDLDAEAERYRTTVQATGLDLTLVGLGMNGHVGLNEPGSLAGSITRRVGLRAETRESMLGYGGERSATWGITLGLSEIMSSRELWLLVSGESKAAIAREVVAGPIAVDRPASLLRSHHNYRVFLDESAGADLA
jgi:6-phosphogluconolactonase/glucosamine-6-phosphate isomerase/deaminase